MPVRRRAAATAAALALLPVGGMSGLLAAIHLSPTTRGVLLGSAQAVDDTYTLAAAPRKVVGDWAKLVASAVPTNRKVVYVKFRVTDLPADATDIHAVVRLTRDLHHFPSTTLTIRPVARTDWSEDTLAAADAPAAGAALDSVPVGHSMSVASLDVSRAVTANGTYAFAVSSSSSTDVVSFRSTESGVSGPRLLLSYRHRPSPKPTTSSPAPAPTTTSPAPAPTTTSPAPAPTTTSPAPTPSPTGSTSCSLSARLVPSCGVLLGGAVTSWGGASLVDKVTAFESGTGTHLDLVHDYRQPGQALSSYDVQLAKRPGTYLQLNWKPVWKWAEADGSNATVNGNIDAMARSIAGLGSKKIFLTIFHEPENDVTGGATGCSYYKGSAGTPAEYRAMWHTVRSRFAALGVSNVVWVMNYMNYPTWDCMVDDLWPGNDLVDWVFFESYSGGNSTYQSETGRFYSFLTNHSDTAHDYLSKPWGIGEFGTVAASATAQHAYYGGIRAALDDNLFPKVKLLSVFDSKGTNGDDRVRYDNAGTLDPTEVREYVGLASDPNVGHLG